MREIDLLAYVFFDDRKFLSLSCRDYGNSDYSSYI